MIPVLSYCMVLAGTLSTVHLPLLLQKWTTLQCSSIASFAGRLLGSILYQTAGMTILNSTIPGTAMPSYPLKGGRPSDIRPRVDLLAAGRYLLTNGYVVQYYYACPLCGPDDRYCRIRRSSYWYTIHLLPTVRITYLGIIAYPVHTILPVL
jgi:hypothetical protein